MTPELLSSSIIPFTWTDHSAVLTTFTSPIHKVHDPTWHINNFILSHPSYFSDLEKALREYLVNNATIGISQMTLWEAHKPVLRGVCIRQASFLKKEKHLLQQKLEAEFNSSHVLFESNPNPKTKSHLDKAHLDLNLFLSDSADKMLCKSRHLFYVKANKLNTLLVRALNKLNHPSKPIRLKLSQDTRYIYQ